MVLQSCEDFIEVDLPPNQLTGKGVFEEASTAEAAITDIYSYQRDQGILSGDGGGITHSLALYSDELISLGTQTGDYFELNTHNVQPSNGSVRDIWKEAYFGIYAANAAIEGLESSVAIDETITQRLIGEAYFIRAFLHFYLTNLFGEIPYVTTTDYINNSSIEKNTIPEVESFLIEDLEKAQELLPENYLSPERIRPNRFAAKALLSRIYLYNGNWIDAENTATAVIELGLYQIDVPIESVFLATSPGTIWQFKSQFNGSNTKEALNYILVAAPPQSHALRDDFVAGFRDGDRRREVWVDSISDGNEVWYFSSKYNENQNTSISLEYSKVLRIAEIYLIRAEARLRLGNIEGAKQDLNAVRERAGLLPVESIDPVELETEILYERKVELFTEFGHRWFDLKRYNQAEAVLAPIKNGWDESSYLLPIPETELSANPNLDPQNPGY